MGASRVVQLNIIGNSSGAQQALKAVGDHSEANAKRMSSAFSGVLGTLNSTGVLGPFGESLDKISGMFDKIGEHGKGLTKAMSAAGGASLGVGGILTGVAGKDQEAQAQLKAAVEATGGSYNDFKDRVEKAVKSNEKYGKGAADTNNATRILATAFGDTGKALDNMQLVANLAAAKHESLADAATQVAKAHGGSAKIFKEFGVQVGDNIDGTKDYDQALAVLSNKVSGQASASVDSFGGKIKVLKTQLEDHAAALGQKYGPALMGVGAGLSVMGQGLDAAKGLLGHFKGAQEAAAVATEGLAGAEDAEAASSTLALGPIVLIVAAVAAVGFALYELWNNWDTVWGWIKGAVKAAKDWIAARIDDIVDWVKGLPRRLKEGVGDLFGFLKTAAADAKQWVSDRVDDIVKFLLSIPGKIAGLGGKIFHEIVSNIPGGGLVASVADKIGGLMHWADGGRPPVGVPSIIGENGPEVWVPDTAGTIIPNGARSFAGGGGMSIGEVHFHMTGVTDPVAFARTARDELLRMARANVNIGLG